MPSFTTKDDKENIAEDLVLPVSQHEYSAAGSLNNETATLLEISNDIAAIRNKHELIDVLVGKLKVLLPFDDILLTIFDREKAFHKAWAYHYAPRRCDHPAFYEIINAHHPVNDGLLNVIAATKAPHIFDIDALLQNPNAPLYMHAYKAAGIMEIAGVIMRYGQVEIGGLFLTSEKKGSFKPHHLSLIKGISSQLCIAAANIIANEKIEKQFIEINNYKQQLEEENLYLQEEIQTTHNYSEIIGTSPAMQQIFGLVSQVAASQSSVLILGETGTGKELIARALHNASPRKDKLMVKVNCASLPANLIESELFGHERGSFTGATERRIGKFELANNSTLFLDEVGELPLDLQVKLLRALQEKEIERVGGSAVIKVNVRIIAATNRNLQKEVQAGNFRSDLFFRLNVFPITLPPLRDRKQDVPVLAAHFLQKHAKKGARNNMNFSSKVIKQLTAYNWPGNVRELEHLIERSILLTKGSTINQVHLPVNDVEEMNAVLPDAYIKTIDEVEREHIISVLMKSNGKVAGVGGAAEMLRIPSTTLNSKIRRLQIKKGFVER